ncbi:MAG: hypothetical protein WAM06_07945 [Methyloceanibacter sp.]|jgi:hypothetical protein
MMTEVQFLNRFQRQPNGEWACTKPIKINGPSGPLMIDEGTSFSPGALFMGLDLAKELDQMAAKHRLSAARPASSRESVGDQRYD